MRSRPRLNDSQLGLVIAAALVAVACWVTVTIDRHREEHGHHIPAPLFDVKGVHRPEDRAERKGQHAGGGHASFFATGRLSDAVRRVRTDSDKRP